MKKLLIIILLSIVNNIVYSQQDTLQPNKLKTSVILNSRSNKIDTIPFDYYYGIETELSIKNNIFFNFKASYERDNGNFYYKLNPETGFNYAKFEYLKDQEKTIEYFSSSIYYPFWKKRIKIGYDYEYNIYKDINNHNIYIGFKYDFLKTEISFFENVKRFKFSINPKIEMKSKYLIGIDINGLYLEDEKFIWNSGLKLTYNMKI